jgi:signal transduction histidine kinase
MWKEGMRVIEPVIMNRSLEHRIQWLIKLRWPAATGVFLTITIAKYILGLELPYVRLYLSNLFLFIYNAGFYAYSHKLKKLQHNTFYWNGRARFFTNVQITLDLIMLTYFIHLSGATENPFLFYFIFHMVIASIILSSRAAFFQTTLVAVLFGFVAAGEYSGILPHYHLGLFIPESFCILRSQYSIIIYAVLVTTLFITTYFATSIVKELREGEVELENLNRELEEKDKLKSQYVKRVSHDLKSSLSAIQSCLNVVLNGLTGSISRKSKEMVGRAEARTQQLTHFVKELWNLSWMRVTEDIDKAEVSIVSVLEAEIEKMKPVIQKKGLSVELYNNAGDAVVYINEYMLEELLTNLIENAINYSREGKISIGCEVSTESGFLQISVQDQGIGIPQESLLRVFDDFYRAENAKKMNREGSGLGLSIVKHIIEVNGGKIWVRSTLDRGSLFTFTLPKKCSKIKNRR